MVHLTTRAGVFALAALARIISAQETTTETETSTTPQVTDTTTPPVSDTAVGVSTLDFKNKFVESGIVPEVIAALDPSVSFYAAYVAANGSTTLLTPGTALNPSAGEKPQPVEFSVEGLNNATNITASTRYLIYLLDADAPARNDPSSRNERHFLAGNYSVTAGVNSTVLPTAQRLTVPTSQFAPFTPFSEPQPQANTGVHRFIMALYTQPEKFNTAGFESVGMDVSTTRWNLSAWRTQLGLGPAIGATFFTIDTGASNVPDGNPPSGTTGGNGDGTTTTPGAGQPTSGAPADVSASGAYMAAITVFVSLLGFMALA